MALLWCPFCHELFESAVRDTCPDCGVLLRTPEEPPEARPDPLHARLPRFSPAGGRGLLLLLATLGLGLFFAPWLVVRIPARYVFSGFELMTTRGFWFGGGTVAYLVLIALIASRSSLAQLRGVRLVSSLLASVTAWQALLVVARAGARQGGELGFEFTHAFYLSALLSVVASLLALRLGGPLPADRDGATGDDALADDLNRDDERGATDTDDARRS